MARHAKISQSHLDENLKAKKRARKPEVAAGKAAGQVVRRRSIDEPGGAAPERIRELQQSVGNRVVAQMVAKGGLAGPAAVQREPFTPASGDKDELVGSPSSKTLGPRPGAPAPVPVPYPNMAAPSQAAPGTTKVKMGANAPGVAPGSNMSGSAGNEPGTMKGITSASATPIAPIQSPVTFEASGGPLTEPEEQAAN